MGAGRFAPSPSGELHLGNLRRVTPVSRMFGLDRGVPVDRYCDDARLSVRERLDQRNLPLVIVADLRNYVAIRMVRNELPSDR